MFRNVVYRESKQSRFTLQISANFAPLHHCRTASMSSILKLETYSSAFTSNFDSCETLAMRRAVSCITSKGAAKSCFRLICCDDY